MGCFPWNNHRFAMGQPESKNSSTKHLPAAKQSYRRAVYLDSQAGSARQERGLRRPSPLLPAMYP